MARENFGRAIEFVLRWEGGYSNDPSDPGGETKYGISKRAHPDVDIANLTLEDAKTIYRAEYWVPLGCDGLDWPLDLVCMDSGVNLGPSRAREFLNNSENWQTLLLLRIKHYIGLRQKYPQFIFGWLNRAMDLFEYARTSQF